MSFVKYLCLFHLSLASTEWEREKTQEYEERKKRKAEKQQATDENENGVEGEEKMSYPRGALLKLTNLPAKVDRDAIKKAFANLETNVAFVDTYNEGSVYVRFRGENAGKQVINCKLSFSSKALE